MVKIGTQFRSTIADGNPLWTVYEKRGRGVWMAEVNADEPDYAGHTAAFTTEQIAGSIAFSKMIGKSQNESNDFFESLKPGKVVHYHNGFNQYVRCQVTANRQLVPIALVGKWTSHDLPRRERDGTITYGYHADSIVKGKPFRPHASNVWEFKGAHQTGDIDPTTLKPIPLEVPAMTPQEETEAAKYQKLEAIRGIVNDHNANPDDILKLLKTLL